MSQRSKQPPRGTWMKLDEEYRVANLDTGNDEPGIGELSIQRRSFLKALGISGALTLSACERIPVRHALPYLTPPEEVTPGELLHYASTCAGCSAACGSKIGTRDGRPIKLEGLPNHPLSHGGLCATGQAELRGLYDAGRLRTPQVDGKEVPWTELDAIVRRQLTNGENDGDIVVLSKTIVSPTARAAIASFLDPLAGKLIEYDVVTQSASGILEAYELLDGHAIVPSLQLQSADLMVGFGADFLGAGPDPVVHTAAYAKRRRQRKERDFVHIQVEGSLSLSGSAADERLQATASERQQIILGLLHYVSRAIDTISTRKVRSLLGRPSDLGKHEEWVRDLAGRLIKHRERTLIVSGATSIGEQVAVALLNRMLGAEGHTIDLDHPSLSRRGRARALKQFHDDLQGGRVRGVIFLDCNPVEELPHGETWAEAIQQLPLSVSITNRPHATAAACQVVAATHHALESWGDAAVRNNLLTLQQPAIRPLFNTRHGIENFLRWRDSEETDYRLHLMSSWREKVFDPASGVAFEQFWNESLASGNAGEEVAAASRWAKTDPDQDATAQHNTWTPAQLQPLLTTIEATDAGGLEVEVVSEVAMREGNRAFNPWLRELPDPLTRSAWIGAIRMAPQRARDLGIEDGDVLAVKTAASEVRMPVRILPGQHPNVLAVPVGYGVVDGDSGDSPRNAFQLTHWSERGELIREGLVATVETTGEFQRLPIIQPHPSAEGRDIIATVSSPDEKLHMGHHGEVHSLWKTRDYKTHWEMVIDLDACTGCSACVIACQAENNIPIVGPDEMARHHDMAWLRIDRYFEGPPESPDVLFEPMLCAQCDNAPCETVCPVAATVHGHDGLNNQAYNRCVGTRYCANNCPYKVRRFNWFNYGTNDPIERMALNPDVVVRERGIMEKCTFCVQRIQRSRIEAKREGETTVEVETACQQSCPAKAIHFGDAAAAETEIDHLKHEGRAFQVLAETGVEPSITYLARIRRRDERKGSA